MSDAADEKREQIRALLQQILASPPNRVEETLAAMSPQDQETLRNLFEVVAQAMESDPEARAVDP